MANLLNQGSIVLTPTAYDNGKVLCVKPSDGSGDFDFLRATEATRINSQGLVEVVADNLPRINYDGFSFDGSGNIIPDSGCGSWLFEPQSTNLIPYSEDFSQWNIVRSTSTANALISPSGETNADKLQSNTTGASGSWYREFVSSFSGNHIFSVFAKAGTTDFMQLRIDGVGGVVYDLSDGTVKSQTSAIGSVEDYGNGWYRCSAQATASSSTTVLILVGNVNMTTVNWFATSGDNIYIWGAQLEAKPYATSYIPTSGQASGVTRNSDVCANGGSAASINSSDGVLFGQFSTIASDNTSAWINLSDGTSNNWLFVGRDGDKVRAFLKSNGVVIFSNQTTPLADINKVALSYKSGDIRLYINGVQKLNLTSSFAFSQTLTRLDFGVYNGGATTTEVTWKQVAVWKETLTDTELQELTTI